MYKEETPNEINDRILKCNQIFIIQGGFNKEIIYKSVDRVEENPKDRADSSSPLPGASKKRISRIEELRT